MTFTLKTDIDKHRHNLVPDLFVTDKCNNMSLVYCGGEEGSDSGGGGGAWGSGIY